MSGAPTWFEIGVSDPERARTFYAGLLGWRFEPPAGGGDGSVIATAGIPGGLHGGDAGASPLLFFGVDDLDAAVARVRELGGEVEHLPGVEDADPDNLRRFGRFAYCRDDQGSSFGLHQPPRAG